MSKIKFPFEKVTIQPTKTCPLMLILMKTLKTINNLQTLEKRDQLPAIKKNYFIEICLSNLYKDGTGCCFI
jgi:hypothetical protein